MMEITQGMIDKLARNGQLQAAMQEHMTKHLAAQREAEQAASMGLARRADMARERAKFHTEVVRRLGRVK